MSNQIGTINERLNELHKARLQLLKAKEITIISNLAYLIAGILIGAYTGMPKDILQGFVLIAGSIIAYCITIWLRHTLNTGNPD